MSSNEQTASAKGRILPEKSDPGKWHRIGRPIRVKSSITYRTITLLVGVLVALLIALTLWTALPAAAIPGENPHRTTGFQSLTKKLYETTLSISPN